MHLYLDAILLRAVALAPSPNDVRQYLRGVLVEIDDLGGVFLVGTNGEHAYFGRMPPSPEFRLSEGGPSQVVIPLSTISNLLKIHKHPAVLLEFFSGEWALGGLRFTPVEGTFPRWRGMLPTARELVNQNPALPLSRQYLETLTKAAKVLGTRAAGLVLHPSNSGHVVLVKLENRRDFFAVISPRRMTKAVEQAPDHPLHEAMRPSVPEEFL